MKEALLAQFDLAQEFFDRSTASLTEEDSGFAPAEGLFTVAQQVAHAAHTVDWFLAGAFDPNGFDMGFEDHDRQIRKTKSLAEARAWFRRAIDNGRALARNKSEAEWSALIRRRRGHGRHAPNHGDGRHHRPHRAPPRRPHDLHAPARQDAAEPVHVAAGRRSTCGYGSTPSASNTSRASRNASTPAGTPQ